MVRGYKGVLLVVSHGERDRVWPQSEVVRGTCTSNTAAALLQPAASFIVFSVKSCLKGSLTSSLIYNIVLPSDRAFMDAVAPKLLVLKGDGLVRMFQGSYSEVRAGIKCGL